MMMIMMVNSAQAVVNRWYMHRLLSDRCRRLFSLWKTGRSLKLITHFHTLTRLRMGRDLLPLPIRLHVDVLRHRDTSTLFDTLSVRFWVDFLLSCLP